MGQSEAAQTTAWNAATAQPRHRHAKGGTRNQQRAARGRSLARRHKKQTQQGTGKQSSAAPPVTSSFVRFFRAWAITALALSTTLPSFSLQPGGGDGCCGIAGQRRAWRCNGGNSGEGGRALPRGAAAPRRLCRRGSRCAAAAWSCRPHLSAWQMACVTASWSATSHSPACVKKQARGMRSGRQAAA